LAKKAIGNGSGLFAKGCHYLDEYAPSVIGQKAPVDMFEPVFHVELPFELYGKFPAVFALEPSKQGLFPLAFLKSGEPRFFVYDSSLNGAIQQLPEFFSEILKALCTHGPFGLNDFHGKVDKPDHGSQAHGPVLVRTDFGLCPRKHMQKTEDVLFVGGFCPVKQALNEYLQGFILMRNEYVVSIRAALDSVGIFKDNLDGLHIPENREMLGGNLPRHPFKGKIYQKQTHPVRGVALLRGKLQKLFDQDIAGVTENFGHRGKRGH
jgi:hypothetical protein